VIQVVFDDITLDFTDEYLLGLFFIADAQVYDTGGARPIYYFFQLGGIALKRLRFYVMTEQVSRRQPLTTQKARLFTKYFSFICFDFQAFHHYSEIC
jgi:hypothetical protein